MTEDVKTEGHTPTPWVAEWPDADADYPDRGAAFITATGCGLVGAALPLPTESESGDFTRVWENAKFIVTAVNERSALLRVEEALRQMVAAIKASSIDSEELPGDMDSGIAPYKWHEEWDFHARAALTLLDEARHGK